MQPQYYGAAADYNRPRGFRLDKRIFILAGLAVVAIILVSVGLALFNSLTSGPRNNLSTLIAREQQLTRFIDGSGNDVKNGELRKVNSDAWLFLTTDYVALTKQMSSTYGQSKIPDDISKKETDTTSATELKSANQVGRYDNEYYEILRDKLAATISIAQTVKGESSGTLRTTVEQTLNNLSQLDEQLKIIKL